MTVIRRGNKFGVKVRDSAGRQKWIGTFPSRELAERAEAEALGARSSAPTVGQWGRMWLSDYARSAKATQRTYKYAVERIIADLGSVRLDKLDRPTARQFANRWARNTTRVARTM